MIHIVYGAGAGRKNRRFPAVPNGDALGTGGPGCLEWRSPYRTICTAPGHNRESALSAYVSLFFVSFMAATVVPFYSEFAVAGMIGLGKNPHMTLLVATLGNTLGATVNWAIGRFLLRYRDRKWFPADSQHLEKAQRWFGKYGVWSLLLAWMPIGGDALTFVAGVMRVRFPIFFCLTATGKGARYAFLIYLVDAAVNV